MTSGYEPRLTEPLKASCVIREGQPVKLSCRFDAYPKGEIQWLKDGVPIDFAALGISRDFTVCLDEKRLYESCPSSFVIDRWSKKLTIPLY